MVPTGERDSSWWPHSVDFARRRHTHSKGVAAAAKTVVEASASAVAAAEKAAADSISQACPAANLPAGLVKQYAAASVRAAGGSASALLTALPVLLAVAALQREGGSGSRFEADAEKRELSGNGDGDGSDALEQRPSEQAALHGLVVVHAFSPGVSVEVSIGAVDGRVVACQVHIIEPTAPGIDDLEGTSALEGDLSGDIQLATGSSGFSALDEEAELLSRTLTSPDQSTPAGRAQLEAGATLEIGVQFRAAAVKRLLHRLQTAHLAGATRLPDATAAPRSPGPALASPAASAARWMLAVEKACAFAVRDKAFLPCIPLWLPDRCAPVYDGGTRTEVPSARRSAETGAPGEGLPRPQPLPHALWARPDGAGNRRLPTTWQGAVQEALWHASTAQRIHRSPGLFGVWARRGRPSSETPLVPSPLIAWACSRLPAKGRVHSLPEGYGAASSDAQGPYGRWVRPLWLPRYCPAEMDGADYAARVAGTSETPGLATRSPDVLFAVQHACAPEMVWLPGAGSCATPGLLATPFLGLPLALPLCAAAETMLLRKLRSGSVARGVGPPASSTQASPVLPPAARTEAAGVCRGVPAWRAMALVHAPRLLWQPVACHGQCEPLLWSEGHLEVELLERAHAAAAPVATAGSGGKRPASDMEPELCARRVSLRTVTVVSTRGKDRLVRYVPLFPATSSLNSSQQQAGLVDPADVAARWAAAVSCCSALRLATDLLGTCGVGQQLWTAAELDRNEEVPNSGGVASAPAAPQSEIRGILVAGAEVCSSGSLRIRVLVVPQSGSMGGAAGDRLAKSARSAADGNSEPPQLLQVSILLGNGAAPSSAAAIPAPAAAPQSLVTSDSSTAALATRGISLRVDCLSAVHIVGAAGVASPFSAQTAADAWAAAGLLQHNPSGLPCPGHRDPAATALASRALLLSGSLGTMAALLLHETGLASHGKG